MADRTDPPVQAGHALPHDQCALHEIIVRLREFQPADRFRLLSAVARFFGIQKGDL